jgi:hypothetical protein
MWSRFLRRLIGLFVLGLAGWSFIYLSHRWDHVWQKEQAELAKSKPVSLIDPTLANDPSVAPAKIKVIGPLATAMEHEQEDPSGMDDTATAEPAPSAQPTTFAHMEKPSTYAPHRFHSTFLVKSYRYYRLLVPVRAGSPKLRGRFAAFAATADKSAADAELLLLDENQFNDFVHGRINDAVFSSTSSVGIIDVTLSPGVLAAKKYYLVFRSPDKRPRLVTADLMESFD